MKRLCLVLVLLLSAGLHAETLGIRNKNPGNILARHGRFWRGVVGVKKGYLIFATDEDGVRAMRSVLLHYRANGLCTAKAIVRRWVGPTQEKNYLIAFCGQAYVSPEKKMDLYRPDVLAAVAKALIFCENSKQPYPESLFRQVFHY